MKSNEATVRYKLDLRIGFRNLEDAHYSSVLNIPFVYIEGGLLPHPTLTYELYIDEGGDSENDSRNLMLVPVRKFRQDTQERRHSWIRATVEGLKTKDGVFYGIRNAGEFSSTPLLELSDVASDDESGLVAFVAIGTGGKSSNGENQVIQCVPQVGDTVADNQSPPLKVWDCTNSAGPKPVFGALLIALEDKFVRVSLEPCRDFTIDDFEVVVRPS
ncbi:MULTISPECIES: hypothetical protein [Acidobacteriaceae]|uniref:hypothetical protein n=1 Tax=Acidobacteriaceae TaxID=204434 RepID=UPI00131C35B9|nr:MULTISPECIES: hypothetical protein [Acidobacteriaceae]MDW5265737.1 hypothetical protein [Edaphobacter sp.]